MPLILKKTLIKWSTLAVLGVSAYFLGYFWGVQHLGNEANSRTTASVNSPAAKPEPAKSNQATDLGKLK